MQNSSFLMHNSGVLLKAQATSHKTSPEIKLWWRDCLSLVPRAGSSRWTLRTSHTHPNRQTRHPACAASQSAQSERDLSIAGMYIQSEREIYQSAACIYNIGMPHLRHAYVVTRPGMRRVRCDRSATRRQSFGQPIQTMQDQTQVVQLRNRPRIRQEHIAVVSLCQVQLFACQVSVSSRHPCLSVGRVVIEQCAVLIQSLIKPCHRGEQAGLVEPSAEKRWLQRNGNGVAVKCFVIPRGFVAHRVSQVVAKVRLARSQRHGAPEARLGLSRLPQSLVQVPVVIPRRRTAWMRSNCMLVVACCLFEPPVP